MKAPLPDRESQRIAQLLQYGILNPTAEVDFEDFTRLAALTCGTPMAAISIVWRYGVRIDNLQGVSNSLGRENWHQVSAKSRVGILVDIALL